MRSEKEKMLAGELYNPQDPQLQGERKRCREICRRLNDSAEDQAERSRILADLFGKPTNAWIEPPFHCDYGTNITLGENVYFNFGCVVLDVNLVTLGSNVMLGPGVQIYTATHPIDPDERRAGLESGDPVSIGSDVWIGGGAIVLPGVTIGEGTVIGAGSVVTRSIPGRVVAAGNPCRVSRSLILSK